MPRSPRSALTLIRELDAVVPNLKVEQDDEDGFKVYRTFRLTSGTHRGLADVITAVADERIVQSKAITNGVEVTFVADRRADTDTPFDAAGASSLISKKTTKKRAAKKAAPKNAD